MRLPKELIIIILDANMNVGIKPIRQSYLLPSQIEITKAIEDLKLIASENEIEPNEETNAISCKAISLLSILKECNLAEAANYYAGSINSKCGNEFFSYMERNNLLAEENLRGLINTEGFLEKCVDELSTYCQRIILPDESPLESVISIDPLYADIEKDSPNAFLWSWGPIRALVVPPHADITNLLPALEEAKEKYQQVPRLLIVMQFKESPLTDCDPYFGTELWYDLNSNPLPLSWQERKTIIEMIKY